MKKLVIICLLLSVVFASLFAQSESSNQERAESYTYRNIGILKVLNHPQGYVVIYSKGATGTANVLIPKDWFKPPKNKAVLRELPPQLNPYMTVTYRDGEFDFVMLTLPSSYRHNVWGILSAEYDISSKLNIDTLDIQY